MAAFLGQVAAMLFISAILAAAASSSSATSVEASSSGSMLFEPYKGSRRILGVPSAEEEQPVVDGVDGEDEVMRRVLVAASQYGGNGGSSFIDGIHDRVSTLLFRCGNAVDKIETKYTDSSTVYKHGGSGGSAIRFNFDFNSRLQVDIYCAPKPDTHVAYMVRGIQITQGGRFIMCGAQLGDHFTLSNVLLKGFYGKAGLFLDQIGIFYE